MGRRCWPSGCAIKECFLTGRNYEEVMCGLEGGVDAANEQYEQILNMQTGRAPTFQFLLMWRLVPTYRAVVRPRVDLKNN